MVRFWDVPGVRPAGREAEQPGLARAVEKDVRATSRKLVVGSMVVDRRCIYLFSDETWCRLHYSICRRPWSR